jgi:hypothetical protein
MTGTDAKLMSDHLTSLKVWIDHWQADRLCNLIPTESSLTLAKSHAECALTILARIEAEQKEAA